MWAQKSFCRTDIYNFFNEEQNFVIPVVTENKILKQICC